MAVRRLGPEGKLGGMAEVITLIQIKYAWHIRLMKLIPPSLL